MSTIGNNFSTLASLDINGDKRLTRSEVEVWQKLSALGDNPPVDKLNDLYNSLPDAQKLIFRDLGKNPNNNLNFDSAAKTFSKVSADKPILPGLEAKGTLASDILDGNKTININGDLDTRGKPVISTEEQQVADVFFGKGKKDFPNSFFEPSGFNFEPEKLIKVRGKEIKVDFDMTHYKDFVPGTKDKKEFTTENLHTFRENLGNTVNNKGQSYQAFLADKLGYKKGDADMDKMLGSARYSKLLVLTKDFVSQMPPEKKAEFIQDFMAATTIHSGGGVREQERGSLKNFKHNMNKIPSDPIKDKKLIDCTYYALCEQYLLSSPKNKTDTGIFSVELTVTEKDGKTQKSPHTVLTSVDNSDINNPKCYIWSNNNKYPVSTDDLKAAHWDGKSKVTPELVLEAGKKYIMAEAHSSTADLKNVYKDGDFQPVTNN
jgi:hypothetical protein